MQFPQVARAVPIASAALAFALTPTLGAPLVARADGAALHQVYANGNFQPTGISVSRSGRFFVNYPRWSDRYLNAVVEIAPDGRAKPYPNLAWNRWDGKAATAGTHFICVQSVVADGAGSLWVVDAAAPLLGPIVAGGPKLVQIDLTSNRVVRTILVPPAIAHSDSYLNDIRFDLARRTAYLTDSGHPGLIVVDLTSGIAHRALDGDPSVKVAPGVQVVVDGKRLLRNGKPPQFNADSIALSPDGAYLYYKPVTAIELYRIKTSVLRASASPAAVAAAVEPYAKTFPTDGLWMTKRGDLYLSDVTHDAVTRLTPDRRLERIVADRRLQWPDTFSQDPAGGDIFISSSQINNSRPYNGGVRTRTTPYAVYEFVPR